MSKRNNPANNIMLLKVMMLKNKKPINVQCFWLYRIPFKARKKNKRTIVSGLTRTNEVANVGSARISKTPKKVIALFLR